MQEKIELLQARNFGTRFAGACLAKISLPSEFAERLLVWSHSGKNFLVICGPAGVGKTYLCAAMLEDILAHYRTYRIWHERSLLERVRGLIGLAHGDYFSHLHTFIDDDIVIVDDIGSSGYSEWREEILMELVDFRYKDAKPTIFTSNLTKQNFYDTYNHRIPSRLFAKQNTILDFTGMPDQRALGN